MIRWNNDYNRGAHPAILEALMETNSNSYGGYGKDEWQDQARREIQKYLQNEQAEIHFVLGGTQANYTVIAAALRPYQGVISNESAHIHVHETGAVENTGHKILAVKGENGKLTAEAIAKEAENFRISGVQEHITMPKFVFLSSPSEYGTIYSKDELIAIRKVCDEYNLYLYIDGARMGYGLGAEGCDVTLKDLGQLADAFYIGGTKCGALFGEAVVLVNKELQEHFRSYMKMNGGMLAKGWLLGIQFAVLFKDGLYFDITRHAVKAAMRIQKALEEKNLPLYYKNNTNQQFVLLTKTQMEQIGKNHIFEYEGQYDEEHHICRFCTSWSTVDSDVDVLIEDIKQL